MENKRTVDLRAYFCALLGTDVEGLIRVVRAALRGAEDGELYLERVDSESVSLDDGRVESPDRSIMQGFGLRRVNGKSVCFASGSNITLRAIAHMGKMLKQVTPVRDRYIPAEFAEAEARYTNTSPLTLPLAERVAVLRAIDAYARREMVVTDVSATLSGSYKQILIVRADGTMITDQRPLVRLSVSVQRKLYNGDGKREEGNSNLSGRFGYEHLIDPSAWMPAVDSANKCAFDKLNAGACPSGSMIVVLGPGWAGVLLHEAIGHGLEGDFVWRNETVFADKMGERIGSELVTVVDDGTLPDYRGSISSDDEGTPTERTVLIDKGILVGFMHDRQSARLCGAKETGNGRRESYCYRPQVRMRNTFMLSGTSTPEEIIAATKEGLYMPEFAGGQVDPISGAFVFKSEVAYLIKDGKITTPVIGATLIGNCTTVLTHVDMVGNDSTIDRGAGTCGKGGQSVPVCVGQPTIRLSGGVSVGGTLPQQG